MDIGLLYIQSHELNSIKLMVVVYVMENMCVLVQIGKVFNILASASYIAIPVSSAINANTRPLALTDEIPLY